MGTKDRIADLKEKAAEALGGTAEDAAPPMEAAPQPTQDVPDLTMTIGLVEPFGDIDALAELLVRKEDGTEIRAMPCGRQGCLIIGTTLQGGIAMELVPRAKVVLARDGNEIVGRRLETN